LIGFALVTGAATLTAGMLLALALRR